MLLTPMMSRDYIYRIPKCQMDKLAHASWKCGDPEGTHQHTVFGNRIVRDGQVVPRSEHDCKTSLLTILLQEDNCKEAISTEEWSCIDKKLKKCSLHYGDACKTCRMDKMGRYMAVVEGWLYLAASQCSAPKDGKCVDWEIVDIIATIISPHDRPYTGLCFPQSWDPLRPLKLEGNNRKKLKDYYGVPVA